MLVPKWFEEEYGRDKACSGWYVEINNGDYNYCHTGYTLKRGRRRNMMNQ